MVAAGCHATNQFLNIVFMSAEKIAQIKQHIRDIVDFPKEGILFKDITPLLADGKAFQASIDLLVDYCRALRADKILGIDARGFIFAAAVADRLGLGLIPVRKPGKLPAETVEIDYELEYGKNTIQMHKDALVPGERVVLVDDLLATGGTSRAAMLLVEQLGAKVVGMAFLIELEQLGGREVIGHENICSLISY